jgi:hypothetical protein
MDLHNNALGRTLETHGHGTDNSCCRQAVEKAVSDGKCLYLDSSYGAINSAEDALLQPTNK